MKYILKLTIFLLLLISDFKFANLPPSMIAAGSVSAAASGLMGPAWVNNVQLLDRLHNITNIDVVSIFNIKMLKLILIFDMKLFNWISANEQADKTLRNWGLCQFHYESVSFHGSISWMSVAWCQLLAKCDIVKSSQFKISNAKRRYLSIWVAS